MAMASLSATPFPWAHSIREARHCRRIFSSEQESVGDPAAEDELEQVISAGGCKTCGRSEVMWGCNGSGRIQGGIAAVPGFTWWPIKAFRPCPAFLESGGRYKRQGQRLEEFAYGRRIDKITTDSSSSSSSDITLLLPNRSSPSSNSRSKKNKKR